MASNTFSWSDVKDREVLKNVYPIVLVRVAQEGVV
jgi:hypothetical protein